MNQPTLTDFELEVLWAAHASGCLAEAVAQMGESFRNAAHAVEAFTAVANHDESEEK